MFWNEHEHASCDCELINFDDLPMSSSLPQIASDDDATDKDIDAAKETKLRAKTKKRTSELTGLAQSFMRENTAAMIALQHKPSKEKIITCVLNYYNANVC